MPFFKVKLPDWLDPAKARADKQAEIDVREEKFRQEAKAELEKNAPEPGARFVPYDRAAHHRQMAQQMAKPEMDMEGNLEALPTAPAPPPRQDEAAFMKPNTLQRPQQGRFRR